MSEKIIVEIVPDKEVLINHRNIFQKTLLDNVLDLERYEQIQANDPEYEKPNQQGGATHIKKVVQAYKDGAANAKAYVDICDRLLAADEAGTLAEAWAEVGSVPSPVVVGDDEEEAAT